MSQDLLSEQIAMYILMAVGISFVLLFLVAIIEQQSTKYGWTHRPSTILSHTAQKCQSLFTYCGKVFAQICSFLIQIKDFAFEYLKDLIPYFLAVCIPLFELLSSPLYVLKGYVDQCWKYIYIDSQANGESAEQPPPEAEEVKRTGRRKKPAERPAAISYTEDNCTNLLLLGIGTLLVLVAIICTYLVTCTSYTFPFLLTNLFGTF